jgi:hypothetical protein
MIEDEMHLFFLCSFSKAAWFSHPWYIRSEVLASNHRSIPDFIQAMLTSGHPLATLEYVYTFLWCLWKARNDQLFCRKAHKPYQVFAATQAILQETKLEDQAQNRPLQDLVQKREEHIQASPIQDQINATESAISRNQLMNLQVLPTPGTTVADPWSIPGTKIFTDVAWMQHCSSPSCAGLESLLSQRFPHQQLQHYGQRLLVCFSQPTWCTIFNSRMLPSSQTVRFWQRQQRLVT